MSNANGDANWNSKGITHGKPEGTRKTAQQGAKGEREVSQAKGNAKG